MEGSLGLRKPELVQKLVAIFTDHIHHDNFNGNNSKLF